MLSRMWLLLLTLALLGLAAVPAIAAGDPGDGVPRFSIEGYRVVGNTLLLADEIEVLLAPFTGAQKDFGTVQEALDALQQAYRTRGFRAVAVLLPEQQLEGGTVRLEVVEPRVKAVAVSGNQYFSVANVRRSLPGLQEGEVPNVDAISRSLQVANQNPSRQVTMALQSGAAADELNVRLKVADSRPWHVGLTLDDTGTESTGDLRAGLLFSHANLFDRDHLLTLQYKTSLEEPENVGIYALGYRLPFYALGDSLDFFAAYSDVDSGTVSAGIVDLDVSGKGTVLGLRYNQNFARHGALRQRLSYGLDWRNFENNVDLYGIPLDNEVTVHPVSLTYGASWQGAFAAAANIAWLQNFAAGADGGNEDFARVRQGAKANYNLLQVDLDLLVPLPGQWQLRGRWNGQYTDDPLVPGEYFGLGGADSVRGFEEREVADDRGYFAGAELYTPDLAPLLRLPGSRLTLLGFYDSGHLDRVDALPGETNRTSIASAGGGLRFQAGSSLSARGDYGYVLDGGGNSPEGSGRFHFSVTYVF